MPDGLAIAEFLVAALMVLACLPLVWVIVRRLWLSNRGWVFVCSLGRPATPGTRWVLGVARLNGDALEWYRMLSFALRPSLRISRRSAHVKGTRLAQPDEVRNLLETQGRVVSFTTPDGPVQLSMSAGNCTAVLSWVEASPPGLDY